MLYHIFKAPRQRSGAAVRRIFNGGVAGSLAPARRLCERGAWNSGGVIFPQSRRQRMSARRACDRSLEGCGVLALAWAALRSFSVPDGEPDVCSV